MHFSSRWNNAGRWKTMAITGNYRSSPARKKTRERLVRGLIIIIFLTMTEMICCSLVKRAIRGYVTDMCCRRIRFTRECPRAKEISRTYPLGFLLDSASVPQVIDMFLNDSSHTEIAEDFANVIRDESRWIVRCTVSLISLRSVW